MNKQWSKEQTQKSNKHVKFVLDFIRIQEKKKKKKHSAVKIKKPVHINFNENMDQHAFSNSAWWEMRLIYSLWKRDWHYLIKWEVFVIPNPAISCLSIYTRETFAYMYFVRHVQ